MKNISKLTLFVLLCFMLLGVWYLLAVGVDMMIRNESGADIRIVGCQLNGESISNCAQNIPNQQTVFLKTERIFYPQNNNFSVKVTLANESKEFICKFRKVSLECMAEMAFTSQGLVCAADCVSVYR